MPLATLGGVSTLLSQPWPVGDFLTPALRGCAAPSQGAGRAFHRLCSMEGCCSAPNGPSSYSGPRATRTTLTRGHRLFWARLLTSWEETTSSLLPSGAEVGVCLSQLAGHFNLLPPPKPGSVTAALKKYCMAPHQPRAVSIPEDYKILSKQHAFK